MSKTTDIEADKLQTLHPLDPGLACVAAVASYYRIPSDASFLYTQMGLSGQPTEPEHLLRTLKILGLKCRLTQLKTPQRLETLPGPAILKSRSGGFVIIAGKNPSGLFRLIDPVLRREKIIALEELFNEVEPFVIQVARRIGGEGVDPKNFSFNWFLQSIWRYRKPLAHVVSASFFIQIFALITPVFFQVIIDKVLPHKGYSTLLVLITGLVILGLFDVVLQYLRTFALSHTTNRIDVELGQRLFHHLVRLPLDYFETRSAGQTAERVRELEKIRQFMTGQALFSGLDLLFTAVFFFILIAYSLKLTIIIIVSVPLYVIAATLISPPLRELVKEKFNRGALSQQMLIETIVGIHTVKAAAVEPMMQAQWEERLSAYVKSAFKTTLLATVGQNAIQYINKLTTVAILLFGAKAVIDGELSVGELVAFNMIAAQVAQPILRLSQVWQEFQQVRVSVERLGDILNTPVEPSVASNVVIPVVKGAIEFRNVSFRYHQGRPLVLTNLSFNVSPGEVVGIVGPSGSGKSTLAKILQRLYSLEGGQIFLDGADISQLAPAWLRRNIGVVLQDNLLFNRSVHENIALANPKLTRADVIAISKLSGADEFINKLAQGYDTMIEERGANLSGGQRQRLAIARALANNPPILIFDEATSALDYESERIIQNNMNQIAKSRTVIIIAHRLAALRRCDSILGIVDGRIIERGSHEELLQVPHGFYARLWELQKQQAMQ